MQLKLLGGIGLHASEVKAVHKMEKAFQASWYAYAGLVIAENKGSMEIDALLITHDRLLLVELKEWNGIITVSGGKWYQNGKNRGSSPYYVKRGHAQRLKTLINQEISHRIGYSLHVEAHVVLCGNATPENIPAIERPFVHTLDDFLMLSSPKNYDRIVQQNEVGAYFLNTGKPRPNSERTLSIIKEFFEGPLVKAKEFNVGNFAASSERPWFEHRNKIYREYQATEEDNPLTKGLLRRWDFSQLGTDNALQSIWAEIALRESRIGRYVRDNTAVLKDYLLRSINDLSQEDVTEDTTELYELRRSYKRLDDVLSQEANNWDLNTRIDKVRALLAPFSDLHALKIGHRDVDLHNLWYAEDHKSIIVSGFGTAFFSEKGTVSEHRKLLQSSNFTLPEDLMSEEGEILDPFKIDVFLLGIIAYQICFGNKKLSTVDDVPDWIPPQDDIFKGCLNSWFEKSLSWDPNERYPSADVMLLEFNSATSKTSIKPDVSEQIFEELMMGGHYREDINSFIILNKFPPEPNRINEIFAAFAKADYKKSYISLSGERKLFIKLWSNITVSREKVGSNQRVLQFFKRLEKLKNSSLPTPEIIDIGIMALGGIFVASAFIEGKTWLEKTKDNLSIKEKILLASKLIDSIMEFHEKQLFHGDLHPENILISQEENEIKVLLLDVADFGTESQAFNTSYGPSNPSITDGFGRDKFAAFKIVEELFNSSPIEHVSNEINHARNNEHKIPISLTPLKNALSIQEEKDSESVEKNDTSPKETLAINWLGESFPSSPLFLEADENGYYFNCKWHPNPRLNNQLQCFITANNASLQINIDIELRQLTLMQFKPAIPLSDIVSASKRSMTFIQQPISVQKGKLNNQTPIVELILGLDPVIDMMVERYDSGNDESFTITEDEWNSLKPEHIWTALSETENDIRDTIYIESEEYKTAVNGDFLFPYTCLSGNDLTLDGDDAVLLYFKGKKEPFGELNLNETTPTFIAIKTYYDAVIKQLKSGTAIQIESVRNKSSRELRHRAQERVLKNKSVILNLAEHFDKNKKGLNYPIHKKPSIEELRRLYDSTEYKTNEKQLIAFQQLIELGPVGVLQGPPGTGKTTFVSKFIHYLYEFCGAKNILLVGQQHAAVDNVAIKAQDLCREKGMPLETVRIGNESMIDSRMLPVHNRALQRQIRHKFHREYETRIQSLSERLLIPNEIVNSITRAHRSLSPLLVIISQLNRQQENINATGSHDSNSDKISSILKRKKEINDNIRKILINYFECSSEEIINNETDLLNFIVSKMAHYYGYNNPERLYKLTELLNLSQEWLDVLHSGEAGFERFMIKTKQLVCGTLVGVGKPSLEIEKTTFDWVIVDEAGRAQASELMVAMQSGKRVLLVGDHKQLPPFYHREHLKLASKKIELSQKVFEESDFERAYKANNGVTLDTQYRMIEPIGDLVSSCFYADDIGKLNTGRGPSPNWYNDLPFPWDRGVSWIDSTSTEGEKSVGKGRYINTQEIILLSNLLQKLIISGAIQELEKTITNEQPHPIGIITMYRAQKEEIETTLSRSEWMRPLRKLIRIDTVDSYQGQENKIIILSLVRDNVGTLQGFLRDAPRINVAISRAQERLIILGASRMWDKQKNDSALGNVYEFIKKKSADKNYNYQHIDGRMLMEDIKND